jgi:hypothetical protein
MNRTHIVWNNGQIAGLLLMALKGAFDHINQQRLLTMMVAKKLDDDLIEWTQQFLTNQTMQIMEDGYDGEVSQIKAGIRNTAGITCLSDFIFDIPIVSFSVC